MRFPRMSPAALRIRKCSCAVGCDTPSFSAIEHAAHAVLHEIPIDLRRRKWATGFLSQSRMRNRFSLASARIVRSVAMLQISYLANYLQAC